MLNSLPCRHKLRLPCTRFVYHSPRAAQSAWPLSMCSRHPAVNPSSLKVVDAAHSRKMRSPPHSTPPHGSGYLNSLCGSHFHPPAGVWSGDIRHDSTCYTATILVWQKNTVHSNTLSFTADYCYMIDFIWLCLESVLKKHRFWNYKRISPWTFIALLQSFDERLWHSDRSGSAVSISLIISSVSHYLHPNLCLSVPLFPNQHHHGSF